MFKGLGNLGSIIKQAQSMGTKMRELNDELKAKRATGSAGGGMVEVDVNGLAEALAVRIEPGFFERGDREMLEDLLLAAVNDAGAKAKMLHAEAMQGMTAGMNLPGLDQALGSLGMSPEDEGEDEPGIAQ